MTSYLVTGAGSGLGRATALRLAGRGDIVFAGLHDAGDGPALEAESTGDLRTLALDVTSDESIEAARLRIAEDCPDGLGGLVNNAGEGFPGPLELLPLDDLRRQLEVNVVGQVACAQAFLPALRLAGGRLVFVSSLGGRATFPFAGAYHASKHAIEAIGDALRAELGSDSNVEVILIEPSAASSSIWPKAIERLERLRGDTAPERIATYEPELSEFEDKLRSADDSGMEADQVARAIEEALTTGTPSARYPVGRGAGLIGKIRPLVPDSLADRLARAPFS